MTHRHKLLTILLLLMLAVPVFAQDDPSPYDIALQRIKEARESGATELDLSSLGLTDLPSELWQLTDLQVLLLSNNYLAELPVEIGQLTNLELLSLSNNYLAELPVEIGQLTNVHGLWLYNNQLSDLPSEIGQMSSLCFLDISNNNLQVLPTTLGNLNQFILSPFYCGEIFPKSELDVENNPLTFPPPEIVGQGTPAILAFLRDEHEKQQAEIKRLIVMSASGVGLIVAIMLGFRLRQQGRKSKKKRDDS